FAASVFSRERDFSAKGAARFAILKPLLKDRKFWILGLVVFLWSFYPFLGTAQFYYQSDVLKFGPVFIGFLTTLSGILGVLAAAFYARGVGRFWSTRSLVRGAVLFGCPLSLLFAFYLGPVSAIAVTVVWGLVGVFFRLSLMDLAAQLCPPYAEATAFAVYMAAFDLAEAGSNAVGGRLYDGLRAEFSWCPHPAYAAVLGLCAIGACCTLSCWWLLPYLDSGAAA
ncbi:MAG: MFS transporter, partial [Elusimicrobia bacterium]|nr:MFS transporter [Elusimicrobiota bacterium]